MSVSCRESSILRLIAIAVPSNGAIYVPVDVEVYLDESEGQNGRRIMCVAGYLFERRAAELLSQEWDAQLARFSLPYFHMVECAHGNGIFSNISKADRISLQT
jgi:hypothetical protein